MFFFAAETVFKQYLRYVNISPHIIGHWYGTVTIQHLTRFIRRDLIGMQLLQTLKIVIASMEGLASGPLGAGTILNIKRIRNHVFKASNLFFI